MEIFKIVALGVVGCVIVLLVKQLKPELAVTVIVAISILMFIYILKYFTQIFALFDDIVGKTGINEGLFSILIKIIGVGYLVEFAASICEDTGNSSIANKVVFAGKVSIFILAMPIIQNLFNLILELL
jgi:stage III sporulation protein AD